LSTTATVSVGAGATLDFDGNSHRIAGLTITGGSVIDANLEVAGNVAAGASLTPSTLTGDNLVLIGTNRTISAAEGAVFNINASVDGVANRVNLVGPGTIRLNQAAAAGHSGGFTMPSGATAPRVIIGNRNALGSGELRLNGGTLEAAQAFTGAEAISTGVSIGGNVTLAGAAMEFTGQVSVFNNATNRQDRVITVENTTTFAGAFIATTTSTTSGGVTTVTQNPADRLFKAGVGTLVLSGAGNTYDDGTTVVDGTLRVLTGSRLGVGKEDRSSIVSVNGNANRNVVLEIQHPNAIDDLLGVVLNSSGTNRGQLFLNFASTATEAVYALNIDGAVIAPGIYNSQSAGFAGFLTGSGNLQVLNAVAIPEPTSLASLILGAGSLLGLRFRRSRVAA
jgi:autotransporter-associated beta strand protein